MHTHVRLKTVENVENCHFPCNVWWKPITNLVCQALFVVLCNLFLTCDDVYMSIFCNAMNWYFFIFYYINTRKETTFSAFQNGILSAIRLEIASLPAISYKESHISRFQHSMIFFILFLSWFSYFSTFYELFGDNFENRMSTALPISMKIRLI